MLNNDIRDSYSIGNYRNMHNIHIIMTNTIMSGLRQIKGEVNDYNGMQYTMCLRGSLINDKKTIIIIIFIYRGWLIELSLICYEALKKNVNIVIDKYINISIT